VGVAVLAVTEDGGERQRRGRGDATDIYLSAVFR
jgi:hypothetical protein